MNLPIRLNPEEIEHIKTIFQDIFMPGDKLWIFGSRVNPRAKGGDIDLYIETQLSNADDVTDAKINFLTTLKFKLGDQKIDVVINFGDTQLPIYEIARNEGIRLV
jgi:hypothetical protein